MQTNKYKVTILTHNYFIEINDGMSAVDPQPNLQREDIISSQPSELCLVILRCSLSNIQT